VKAIESVLVVVYVVCVVATPVLLVAGWLRWAKLRQRASLLSVFSVIGFTLATLSVLLYVSSILYAHAIGGFPYYDPLLMRIYRWGGRLSLSGLAFGIAGCWRPNPLRWYAPLASVAVFLFWCLAAMGE